MSGAKGISGPRRKYEKAPSDDDLGAIVDNGDAQLIKKGFNGTTTSNTEVEFGDGVDLDFSLVQTRQDNKHRSRINVIAISVILVLLLVLAVFINPNYNFSDTPELFPPNYNVDNLCSAAALMTSNGRASCQTICEPASCCFTTDPTNCLVENRIVCNKYSSCKALFDVEYVNIDKTKDIEEIGDVEDGDNELEKGVSTRPIEGEIEDELNKELTDQLTPAPPDINDVCSPSNTISSTGVEECEAACKGGECCWKDTCSEQHQKECDKYQICKSAGSKYSAIEQVKYVCSTSKIGNVSPSLTSIDRSKNIEECKDLCEPRSCCFSNGPNNCYSDNSIWCDEFAACKNLSNTDIDSPPQASKNFDIKNDCRQTSTLPSNDYLKCEQACSIASCCFSQDGCEKKGVNCEDFDVCKQFIDSVENVSGTDTNATSNINEEETFSPKETVETSENYDDDAIHKFMVEQGFYHKEEQSEEHLVLSEGIEPKDSESNSMDKEAYEKIQDLELSKPLETLQTSSTDDYLDYEGFKQDIDKTIEQQLPGTSTSAKETIDEIKESESLPKLESKNTANDDENIDYHTITEDISKTLEHKGSESNDDYFNIEKEIVPTKTTTEAVTDDDYFLIEDGGKNTEGASNQKLVEIFNEEVDTLGVDTLGVNDTEILEALGHLDSIDENEFNEEVIQIENNEPGQTNINEYSGEDSDSRPNISSLVPALTSICDPEKIDDAKQMGECEEACLPALCCVNSGEEDCTISQPTLCQKFSPCNPLWEMKGYHVKNSEAKVETPNENIGKEIIYNKYGDPIDEVDVPLSNQEKSNPSPTEIDGICSSENVKSQEGYDQCFIKCTPALCCVGIGSDCSKSKQDFCDANEICREFWSVKSNTSFGDTDEEKSLSLTSSMTDAPTPHPVLHLTQQPSFSLESLHFESYEETSQSELPEDLISSICSEENVLSPEGRSHCVLECNQALCCVGVKKPDCYLKKMEWCDKYRNSCVKVWQATSANEEFPLTSAPSESPTSLPSLALQSQGTHTSTNAICSKENVESKQGYDHCVLECNQALCCKGVGTDCSKSKSDWCADFQSCSNVWD